MLRTLTLTALLTLSATAVYADDASTLVSYADLDLSKPADAKTMAARLQDAATAVCLKANPEISAPRRWKAASPCRFVWRWRESRAIWTKPFSTSFPTSAPR